MTPEKLHHRDCYPQHATGRACERHDLSNAEAVEGGTGKGLFG